MREDPIMATTPQDDSTRYVTAMLDGAAKSVQDRAAELAEALVETFFECLICPRIDRAAIDIDGAVITVALTEAIDQVLSEIQAGLPQGMHIDTHVFRQADFIHRAVSNVGDAVRDGAILVVIVLVIFLLNLRTTLIPLTAIPLSLAVTALVFRAFDISINTMTLGGIAVAIGAGVAAQAAWDDWGTRSPEAGAVLASHKSFMKKLGLIN